MWSNTQYLFALRSRSDSVMNNALMPSVVQPLINDHPACDIWGVGDTCQRRHQLDDAPTFAVERSQ